MKSLAGVPAIRMAALMYARHGKTRAELVSFIQKRIRVKRGLKSAGSDSKKLPTIAAELLTKAVRAGTCKRSTALPTGWTGSRRRNSKSISRRLAP